MTLLLNDDQERAVKHTGSPLLIVAGPGSGKTRVIVERILFFIQNGVKPSENLCLTFSNKAAEEMKQRLEKIIEISDIQISTIHSFARDLLLDNVLVSGVGLSRGIMSRQSQLVWGLKNIDTFNLQFIEIGNNAVEIIESIIDGISAFKNELVSCEDLISYLDEKLSQDLDDESRSFFLKLADLAKVYKKFEVFQRSKSVVDFDDLIIEAVNLLKRRKDIAKKYQDRFKHILIDEFQDNNFALIISALLISGIALNAFVSFPLIIATTSSISSISSSPSQTESSLLWTTGASMPTERSEVVGVALGEKIYVIGGLLTGHSNSPTNIVEVYDTKTDKWTTAVPLPEPLHHIAAAAYNGKVYVVGGWDAEKNSSKKLFIYDPDANRWQEGKPMPTARGGLTAKFVNGILYAIGGREYEENFFTTNEAYNPQTNTWTEKAPMPTARHHLSSAVVDDKIYVIGGRDKTSHLADTFNVNEMYDTKQDTWTVLESMPSKRAGLAAVASVDGDIYVFGGEKRGGVFDNNEKYDTKTNKWTSEPPMPTARHGIAVEVVGDRIYIIGGGPEPGASISNINEIFRISTSGTQ